MPVPPRIEHYSDCTRKLHSYRGQLPPAGNTYGYWVLATSVGELRFERARLIRIRNRHVSCRSAVTKGRARW